MPFDSEANLAMVDHAADRTPSSTVVACVDGARVLPSVCDHAAWLASRLHTGVEVLQAAKPADKGVLGLTRRLSPLARLGRRRPEGPLLRIAATHLTEQGASVDAACFAAGPLPEVVSRASNHAAVVVVSRRDAAAPRPQASVLGKLRRLFSCSSAPVCVAASFWLPITGVLVCLPARGGTDDYSDWLATCPVFEGLAAEFAALDPAARDRLRVQPPRVFSRPPPQKLSPPKPVAELARREHVDLIVAPREAMVAPGGDVTPFGAAAYATGLPLLAF